MLNGTLTLHDIKDVEAFCTTIANTRPHNTEDHEDLTAYLIAECWILSKRYNHRHQITFSTWAGNTLRKRIIDWERQRHERTCWKTGGRTYERTATRLVPLDQLTDHHTPGMDQTEHREPDNERVDARGNLDAAAYLPPRSLLPDAGIREPPHHQPDRDHLNIDAA